MLSIKKCSLSLSSSREYKEEIDLLLLCQFLYSVELFCKDLINQG